MSGPTVGGCAVAKATAALRQALLVVVFAAQAEEQGGERAAAYMELGAAQSAQEEFKDAVASFTSALHELERVHDPSAIELAEPLIALGNAQMATGRFDRAALSLERAISIARRDGGVNDPRQQAPLLQLAQAQASAGDLQGALGSLKYLERVSGEIHGARSPTHGVALSGIADRQCRYGFFFDGRDRHREALDILSAQTVPAAFRIDALRAAAQCNLHELSYLGIVTPIVPSEHAAAVTSRPAGLNADNTAFRMKVTRLMRRESEQAIVQAAQLAVSSPSIPADDRIAVLLQAGDWFQMKDHVRTARAYYQQALQVKGARIAAESLLSQPVLLLYATPPMALQRRSGSVDGELERRSVLVQFDVRANGRVHGERVLERDATKSMVDETVSALRAARYRPRFAGGKPQDTPAVTLRQLFRQ